MFYFDVFPDRWQKNKPKIVSLEEMKTITLILVHVVSTSVEHVCLACLIYSVSALTESKGRNAVNGVFNCKLYSCPDQ